MCGKYRVIQIKCRFYPQYFDEGILGFFKKWRFYKEEELWLNGIYTFSTECDLSYTKLEHAEEFIKGKIET